MIKAQEEILLRYGEIFLKSDPVRQRYELILENNIKNALRKEGLEFSLRRKRLRCYVKGENIKAISRVLANIAGLVSFSVCDYLKTADLEEIKGFCKKNYDKWIKKNLLFAVRAKRVGKHDYNSHDIENEVGSVIDRKVNLSKPDVTVFVEVSGEDTHIFTSSIKGVGGLPVGASGRILSLLSAGIDSPVSSFMMMKRGCRVDFLHFHSFPLVSNKSMQKAAELVKILNKFQVKSRLFIVPFLDIQMKIKTGVPEKYRVILYRRAMLKIAEKIAGKEKIIALSTGESLGQVSSQTMDNLETTNLAVKLPILRPLIGMDKQEIMELAKKIGTYETSIEPHEDCCTLFVPKHAATISKAKEMENMEKKMKLSLLINKAVKQAEIREIK